MKRTNRIIALLSDFGLGNHYVAALKGVLYSLNPSAVVVDITHLIPPQDICEGALALEWCYEDYPAGTIFIAVVDPGVGSKRRAMCLQAGGKYFVGPDNGIFSRIMLREKKYAAREIKMKAVRAKSISATFHGRDIFAPAAAALSLGSAFFSLGPAIQKPVLLDWPSAVASREQLSGEIISIDAFGNAASNISIEAFRAWNKKGANVSIKIGPYQLDLIDKCFSDGKAGSLIALWNSVGLLEFAVPNASARTQCGLEKGTKVILTMRS